MKYISVLKKFNSVVEARTSNLKKEYKRLCEGLGDGDEEFGPEGEPIDATAGIPVDEGDDDGSQVDYEKFFGEDSTPVEGETELDEADEVTEIPASEVYSGDDSLGEGADMGHDSDDEDALGEDSIEVVDDEILEGDDDQMIACNPDGEEVMEGEGGEEDGKEPEKVEDVASLFDDEGSGDEGGEGATDDGGESADVPKDDPEEKIEEQPGATEDKDSEGDEGGEKKEGDEGGEGEEKKDEPPAEGGEGEEKKEDGGEEKKEDAPAEEPKSDEGGEEKKEEPKEEPKGDEGGEEKKEEVTEDFDPNEYFNNDDPGNDGQKSDTQDGLDEAETPKMVPLSELTEGDPEGEDAEDGEEFTAPIEGEPEEPVTVDMGDGDEPYDTLENPDDDAELDESVIEAFNLNKRLLKKR